MMLRKLRFQVVNDCPVPWAVAPAIIAIRHHFHLKYGRWPSLNSAFRGDEAAGLLKRLHKHTQRFLYLMFIRHVPGYAPANPPTFGTHILVSDGVAYPLKGKPLAQWQCGFDWNDADIPGILTVAQELGMPMKQPYPSGSEYHHTNFIHRPPAKYMRKG